MENNLRNKLELSANSLENLSKQLPKYILQKLEALEGQVYHRYDEFKSILQGLLGGSYEQYKDVILNFVEQIEGDEDTLDDDSGSIYPYDPTKSDIDIREEPQTVYELVNRKWERGLIKMPDFQRKFVWKLEQQSLFIESVLLNFPLPPLYINKDAKGNYLIVDGLQRITTLRRFLMDEFRLKDLKAFPNLNNKNFSELKNLDLDYQSKIEDKKLLVYLIQPSVPLSMVYDIFNRINTGGTQLARQEIRNCIYLGKSTDFLQKLASNDLFKTAIDYGISDNRAKDQEAILRFLSFQIFDYKLDYKNSMNDFVENTMKFINSNSSESDLKNLERKFNKAMKYTFSFFEKKNFRIPTKETRGRINIAIFETVAGFFAAKEEGFLEKNEKQIKANFSLLLNDSEYMDSVRFSTGDSRRVAVRFNNAFDILNKDCVN